MQFLDGGCWDPVPERCTFGAVYKKVVASLEVDQTAGLRGVWDPHPPSHAAEALPGPNHFAQGWSCFWFQSANSLPEFMNFKLFGKTILVVHLKFELFLGHPLSK